MRSVIQLSLLALVVLFAISCKKDEKNNNNGNTEVQCRLSGLYADDAFAKLLYNSDGLVFKIELYENEKYCIDEYFLFYYDSENRMIKAEYYDEDGLYSYDSLTYQGSTMAYDTYDYNTGGWNHWAHDIFEFNADGLVEKITSYKIDSIGNWTIIRNFDLFEWGNDKLIRDEYWDDDKISNSNNKKKSKLRQMIFALQDFPFVHFSIQSGKNEFSKVTTTKYDYDQQKNPFHSISVVIYPDDSNISINNPVIDTAFLHQSGDTIITIYNYEYNEHGYPVSCIMNSSGTNNGQPYSYSDEWSAEYECN